MAAEAKSQATTAKRLYDDRAKVYDDSWHPSFAKYIVDCANLQPGEKLLDLACGTGLVSFPASKKVRPDGSVIGVDVSQGMLKEAYQKLKQQPESSNVTFFEHDISDLTTLSAIKEESFDVITCASAFVLLNSPGESLKSWIKYLKPGGRLVVDVSHPRNQLSGIVWEKVHQQLGITPPYNRTWVKNENSLKILLHQAGFDILNSKFEFKEQIGYSKHYLSIADAESTAKESISSTANNALNTPTHKAKALQLFQQEWKSLSNPSGTLLEIDGKEPFVGIVALRSRCGSPLRNGIISSL
ncbi:S-adenosyl-L-methionine-dependent methyltransferase [Tothia fuscella]|uniref:S-adenosyl-L-methionine-dependent methyltransferase n=1 Tax=Tothia fuscella TaxID=1048955 RepID=A0A9P4NF12_9PEZI|nr:S-adenosyl-L-methionine-dependent methyltransferase [Tothia fuscella]